MNTILIFKFLLLSFCLCVYKDSIGKYNWFHQFIGKYKTIIEVQNLLFVASSDFLGAIDVKSGNLSKLKTNFSLEK